MPKINVLTTDETLVVTIKQILRFYPSWNMRRFKKDNTAYHALLDGSDYDLVVIDMDSTEPNMTQTRRLSGIPTVFMGSLPASSAYGEQALAAGGLDYIQKPPDLDRLGLIMNIVDTINTPMLTG